MHRALSGPTPLSWASPPSCDRYDSSKTKVFAERWPRHTHTPRHPLPAARPGNHIVPAKRGRGALPPAIAARGAQGPCPPRPPVFQQPAALLRFEQRPPLSALGTPRAVQLRRSSPGAAAAPHCLSPAALVRVQARDSCPAGGRATRASTSAWMVGRCQPVWAVTAGLDGVTRRSAGHRAACWLLRLSRCHSLAVTATLATRHSPATQCF